MNPQPNEIYRHFKGNLYKIITLAKHSETEEMMVVYQALYGDFTVYVRPLAMFLSRTDKNKYPDCTQEYRFERVDAVMNPDMTNVSEKDDVTFQTNRKNDYDAKEEDLQQESIGAIDPLILEFLDADTMAEKRNILTALHSRLTEEMISTLSASLDFVNDEGELEDRYLQLKNCIATKEKFECERI